ALSTLGSMEERLLAVFSLKLDLIAPDRRFLGALFRFLGDPEHPASLFGPATAGIRAQSIRTFARILEPLRLDPSLEPAAATLLWAAHLGVLLHALQDRSKGLARSRALLRGLAGPVAQVLTLLGQPAVASMAPPFLEILQNAGLLAPVSAARRPGHERT